MLVHWLHWIVKYMKEKNGREQWLLLLSIITVIMMRTDYQISGKLLCCNYLVLFSEWYFALFRAGIYMKIRHFCWLLGGFITVQRAENEICEVSWHGCSGHTLTQRRLFTWFEPIHCTPPALAWHCFSSLMLWMSILYYQQSISPPFQIWKQIFLK